MAVLVTRPHPDNQRTAHALTLRGIEALLAPMLQFEALPLPDLSGDYAALIVTSANALRAIEQAPALARLQALPVYTVGDHGAQVARAAGFSHVFSAAGDARALAGLVGEQMAGATKPLLYPSAEDISFDLAGRSRDRGSRLRNLRPIVWLHGLRLRVKFAKLSHKAMSPPSCIIRSAVPMCFLTCCNAAAMRAQSAWRCRMRCFMRACRNRLQAWRVRQARVAWRWRRIRMKRVCLHCCRRRE